MNTHDRYAAASNTSGSWKRVIGGPTGAELVDAEASECGAAGAVDGKAGEELGVGLAADSGWDVLAAGSDLIEEVIHVFFPPFVADVDLVCGERGCEKEGDKEMGLDKHDVGYGGWRVTKRDDGI